MQQELGIVIAQITKVMGSTQITASASTAATMTISTNAPATVDRAALTTRLQQLATMLANNDTRAEKLADDMRDILPSLGQGQALAQINQQITEYEFDEALATLSATAKALNISL